MEQKIFTYLDNLIETYQEPVERINGLLRNPKDIIRTVEFYTNNQYLSGNKDALGREKPFYNVCNYRVTVAKTATDLDVKDIRFEPDSLKDSVATMLYNHELYKYLKETNFSKTLNDMGATRPKYGGVLVKNTDKIEVIDWVNAEFDPGDITGGAIIETFHLQPSEVYAKSDVWENIDELMEAHAKANKNKPAKVKIKEISGEFPLSFHPDEEDTPENNAKFKRMCFYVGIVNKKKFLLYYEYEKENKYKYLAWEEVGKGLGKGVVEEGFESQWAINDAMISAKNTTELTGKVVGVTTSKKVKGNAITGVDNGHMFELEPNATLEFRNLGPSTLPQYEKLIELWNQQYDRVASTYDANTGEAPTAGTPYSQTALLNQVANSPFEYQREVWGIWLNEILNDWIKPELKKRIKRKHYLVSEFDEEELKIIDEAITNRAKIDAILKGQVVDDAMIEQTVAEGLAKYGSKREIEIPDGFLDIEGKITANITGELKNKQAVLQSLAQIGRDIVATYNPNTGTYAALEDPTLKKIYGMIVDAMGTPLTSSHLKSAPKAAPISMPELPNNAMNNGRPTPAI